MLKPQVVIASVLKPADDIRSFYKVGQSIAQAFDVELWSWGAIGASHDDITLEFKPSGGRLSTVKTIPNNRFSLKRLLANWLYFRFLLQKKPSLQILETPELGPAALLYKRIHPATKLIYDVRENYVANIRLTTGYSRWLQPVLAHLVQTIELRLVQNSSTVFIAEYCYRTERPSVFGKAIDLPNLALKPNGLSLLQNSSKKPIAEPDGALRFLIAGTLGPHYGTLEGIRWFLDLAQDSDQLTVAGFAADLNYANQIKRLCTNKANITLVGIDAKIDHELINQLKVQADFLLMPYRPNPATANRIPTKLYEALAVNTKVIMERNPFWETLPIQNHVVFLDFEQAASKTTRGTLLDLKAKPQPMFTELQAATFPIYWEQQEPELLKAVCSILVS